MAQQVDKVSAQGVTYKIVDSELRETVKELDGSISTVTTMATEASSNATEAKTSSKTSLDRINQIAPLARKLEYIATQDTSPQPGKFYYVHVGDQQYDLFSGSAFVVGVTYYEINPDAEMTPQLSVDAEPGEMTSGWDTRKFTPHAGIQIGHHARALEENDGFNWNIAIGQNATAGDGEAGDQCCAIGEQSVASKYAATAIGSKARAVEYGATGIGYGCEAAGIFSATIGRVAKTSPEAHGAIMLGPGTNSEPSTVYVGVMDVGFTLIPAGSDTFKQGTSYFTRSGSGTDADPYRYSKYNGVIGATIQSSPAIYRQTTANAKTYKLLGKDGKIPVERLPMGTVLVRYAPPVSGGSVTIKPKMYYSSLVLPYETGVLGTNSTLNLDMGDNNDINVELMLTGMSEVPPVKFSVQPRTGFADVVLYVGNVSTVTKFPALVYAKGMAVGNVRYIIFKITQ